MREVVARPELVARCGLYCGACRSWLNERCSGCAENTKASWCKVRSCCHEHGHASCADCTQHPDPRTCGLFHNYISRMFGLLFRSNRRACVLRIREIGVPAFAAEMAAKRAQSLPR